MGSDIPKDVLVDILFRLPAKCIWRLRSVCKDWKSLIEAPSFADLHLRQSKETCFMVCGSPIDFGTRFYSIDKHGQAVEESVYQTKISPCIDGLICYKCCNGHIKVCNPVTHETISLPKPTFLSTPQESTKSLKFCDIGFDSTTQRYNVLVANWRRGRLEVEIFTLGGSKRNWRKVEAPSLDIWYYEHRFYANGRVYLYTSEFHRKNGDMQRSIVGFNFAEEKFEFLPLPPDIDKGKYTYYMRVVGSSLCLVEEKECPEETKKLKLWTLAHYGTHEPWVDDQEITLPPIKDFRCVFPISIGVMLVLEAKEDNSCSEKYICCYNEEGQVVKSIQVHDMPPYCPRKLHKQSLVSLKSILATES